MVKTKTKSSFLHLELDIETETAFKKKLTDSDLKGKQVLRTLIRKWLKGEIK